MKAAWTLSRAMNFLKAFAFYDIHAGDSPDNGQLHWVAIKKEAQGKGLSKPLITHTLEKMKALGYGKIKIHTQTNTWLACKIYHELGFMPSEESLNKHRFGWKMAGLLTGIDFSVIVRKGRPYYNMPAAFSHG